MLFIVDTEDSAFTTGRIRSYMLLLLSRNDDDVIMCSCFTKSTLQASDSTLALVTNQGGFQLLPLPVRGYFPLNWPSLPPPASSMLAFHASPSANGVYVMRHHVTSACVPLFLLDCEQLVPGGLPCTSRLGPQKPRQSPRDICSQSNIPPPPPPPPPPPIVTILYFSRYLIK